MLLTRQNIIKFPACYQFPGDYGREETPDPIPNSEAKLSSANGTVGVPMGE